MRFKAFSLKQAATLSWWCDTSPYRGKDAVICDGAVRSGKTLCLSLSFVLWAMARFGGGEFALCGKTVTSLRRNVVAPLCEMLAGMGIAHKLKLSQNRLEVYSGRHTLGFSLFGGKDESSAALIQGMTLWGILFDEVALMPRSFVEQALARCSVEGSKFFFCCNPEHPQHWFYTEWIHKCREKNALYLHFTMADNPGLSPEITARYKTLYAGAFYDRYVLGRWVAVQGAVYPMFSPEHVADDLPPVFSRYAVSCDYGTVNPSSFGLWGEADGAWYRMREFYHDSRAAGVLKTDEEYADALEELIGDIPVEAVIVDPSAASFLQCLRRRGRFPVEPAVNDVLGGIRTVAAALGLGKIRIHSSCRDTLREFALYRWDPKAVTDAPLKQNDHAMDDIRYFAMRYFSGEEGGGFFALSAGRG